MTRFAEGDNLMTMKRMLPILLASTRLLLAQTTTITLTGPASITPGSSLNATLSIAGSAGQGIVDLQWSLVLPTGFTAGAPVMASSEPSGDQAQCGTAACLIWGSLTAVADGTLATIPITVSTGATLGTQIINVSGLFAATAQGFNVNGLAPGAAYSVKVLSPCDLNGDGTITVADAQLVVNALVSGGACPISTVNGGCTVVTVVQEIVAAGGGACKIP